MNITFEVCDIVEDFEAALLLDRQMFIEKGMPPCPRADRERLFDLDCLVVIKDGAKVIGYSFFEIVRDVVVRVSLGIAPEYRNKGVGDKFMPYIGRIWRGRGAKQVSIYFPVTDLESPKFYKRWNCQHIGQEKVDGAWFNVYVYHLIGPVRTKPKKD
jgi:GNAT superfamily N-acetyltransferase